MVVELFFERFLKYLEVRRKTGAAGENRTLDPTLTKGVLYH
jgi:hypothetical protein